MLRRTTAGALAFLFGAIALAGCTPTDPPTSSPTPTTIFSSEDEALAAATDVYQQYTAAKDKESSKGDLSAELLRPIVTPTYYEQLEVVGALEKNGWHTDGATMFDSVSLEELDEKAGVATVSISLCRDVSGVTIRDADGNDVTPENRAARFPVLVEFVSSEAGSKQLLISDSGSWPGEDFC